MASILSVEQLQGLAAGSTPNTITIPSGQTLYAPGHVIQVKSFIETTYINAGTGSTYTERMTSFRPYLTPTSSSSKILVMTTVAMTGDIDSDAHSSMSAQYKIDMYTGSASGSGGTLASTLYESGSTLLDRGGQTRLRGSTTTLLASPSTTNEVHFRILTRVAASASGRVLMINNGLDTTTTLMEIAQ